MHNEIAQEFLSDYHDHRFTKRAVKIGESFLKEPKKPFSQSMGTNAEVQAFYYFVNSDSIDEQQTHQAHRDASLKRMEQKKLVLCIHDTTRIAFDVHKKDTVREFLSHFSTKQQGFFCHTSFLVSSDAVREPLGVARFQPFVHGKHLRNQEMEEFWRKRGGVFENESLRWQQAIEEVEQKTPCPLLHLMDSESDTYQLLHSMVSKGQRFVLRHCRERKTDDGTGTWEGWEKEPVLITRKVTLSERLSWADPKEKPRNPAREKRTVTLDFKARQLTLRRSCDPQKGWSQAEWKKFPEKLEINAVYVYETNPPEGEKPVEWILFTTEPIHTAEDVLRVVDLYRTRWMIEEFFKVLKTGCAYEKRQAESAGALLQILALSFPIAWFLLRLRTWEEHMGEESAEKVMKAWEIALLREMTPKYAWDKKKATIRDIVFSLAMLGGHHRKTSPGWLILSRGYESFCQYREGALAVLRSMGRIGDVYEC